MNIKDTEENKSRIEKTGSINHEKDLEFSTMNNESQLIYNQSLDTSASKPQFVLYYVDWILAICYHFDIVAHSVQLSRESLQIDSQQAYKNDQPYHEEKVQKARAFLVSGLQFGIPLIFYLQGIRAKVYDTENNGFFEFFKEKFKSFMIPFFYSVVLFLIPRLYFAQEYQDFARIDGKEEWNFFQYVWKLLPVLKLKLSWLWLFPSIFLISLVSYPLLAFSQRRKKKLPFEKYEDGKIIIGQLIAIGIWSLLNFLDKDNEANSLWNMSMTLILGFVSIYFGQFITYYENGYKYTLMFKAFGLFGCFMLNHFHDQKPSATYGFVATLQYDIYFMSQGIVDSIYIEEQEMKLSEMKESLWAAASVYIWIWLYVISTPIVTEGFGFLFYYPAYQVTWLQNLHVIGTFLWIYSLDWYQRQVANKVFNDYWYDIMTGGSVYAFLSHYLWLVIVNNLICRPLKLSLVYSIFTLYIGTELIILLQLVLCKFIKEIRQKSKSNHQVKDQDLKQGQVLNKE